MRFHEWSTPLVLSFVIILAEKKSGAAEYNMATAKTVCDVAKVVVRAAGAPRDSDVCFSPRWRRPRDADDPYDTFRDAKAFHATRLDWVYTTDPSWIAQCKQRGYWFTGSLNTILVDAPGKPTRDRGRILDKDGNRVAAPWMRKWAQPGYWGCANSPEYRQTFLAHAKILIDGGIDAIQMDDPVINYGAVRWGGCYCVYCLKKAEAQGKSLPADMQAFQADSVREFYAAVRKELDAYAKRRIPWSSNNYDGNMGFPYDLFDYGTAELPPGSAKPDQLYRKLWAAAQSGRQQVYTFVSTDVAMTRRVIATAYACGGHIIVPYDVYNGSKPRIFGKPKEYADLYGFVRAMASSLDGFEDAAAFGKGIEEARYAARPPVQVDVPDVYAMVRAQPGKAAGAVAIHLVDWRKAPQGFLLTLNNGRFFAGRDFEVKLFVPPPYERAIHAKAAEQGNYTSLATQQKAKTTTNGDLTQITVPALSPWGIVILESKLGSGAGRS